MKLYALSGPPGSGKTFYRKKHYPNLPVFDVADVYAQYYGMDSKDAFAELLNRITNFASIDNVNRDIVVEAMLSKNSTQRAWLEYVAEANGYEVEYVEFDTPLEMCILRVRDDWKHAKQTHLPTRAYFNARIKILKALINDNHRKAQHKSGEGSDAEGDRPGAVAE